MKSLFLLGSFILSAPLMAQSNFDVCESQGEKFGKLNRIDIQCRTLAKSIVLKENYVKGNNVEVYGHKNILFIDYKIDGAVKEFKVAGDMTLIKNIRAVSLSSDEKKVYVLDSNQILEFNTMTSGNSAPSKVVATNGNNCSQMSITTDQNTFYLLCSNQIVQGNLNGDSRYKKASRRPSSSSKWKVQDLGLSSDILIGSYKGNFIAVDKGTKKLSSFNLSASMVSDWSLDLTSQTSNELVELKASKEVITVIDNAGNKLNFD